MTIVPLDCAKHAGVDFVKVGADKAAVKSSIAAKIKCPPKGIGDVLARVFEATGVATLTRALEHITGKSCGCGARREKLNKLMPL